MQQTRDGRYCGEPNLAPRGRRGGPSQDFDHFRLDGAASGKTQHGTTELRATEPSL